MLATGNKSYRPLTLSIRIYADGFSFFVCDPQTSSLFRGEHFRVDDEPLAMRLQRELARSEYNNRQIDQAFVLICTPSLHVPLEEFHRDEAASFYAFSLADRDMSDLRVAYTIQPELESVEVYAFGRDVEDAVLQFYPTARFFASRAMLMERLMLHEQDADRRHRRLYACVTAEGLEVIAYSDNRLRFANTFECSASADIQYFTLNAWQMLGYEAEQDHLILISEWADEPTKDLKAAFSNYVRHVDLLPPSDLFSRVPLAREKEMPTDLKALLLNRV
ncbi:MAG: DUF3822 family protein [Bacteroidales bacterium]|nr:DUF3822 family protein [Bacteroidales bacterium]